MSLGVFVEKKGGHGIECSYEGASRVRRDQGADNTEPVGRNEEPWLHSGYRQKPARNFQYKRNMFCWPFENNLYDTLLWADSREWGWKQGDLGEGHWSCPAGRCLCWMRVVAVERPRTVSKLLLQFKSSPNFPNTKIDLASACLSKTFTSLRAKLNCEISLKIFA